MTTKEDVVALGEKGYHETFLNGLKKFANTKPTQSAWQKYWDAVSVIRNVTKEA